MATASGRGITSHLTCGICEEIYNESDHLPKVFPCQHSVCMSCLDKMIERCDSEDIPCPVCRLSVPIPESRAAGFPNNLTIVGMLGSVPASITCSSHPDKTVSAFCTTCQEAICMTCMIKSPKHKAHEVEELADAMERCIQQAQDELDQIVSICSAVHEKIKQKARANNLECFKYLRQLQNCKSDLKADTGVSAEDGMQQVVDDVTKMVVEKPLVEECAVAAGDVLRAASLPQHENSFKVELQTAVTLPPYTHIDMNRSNSLLMTSPQGQYVLYKFSDNKYCHMDQPALSDDSIRMLNQAEDVLLSHDNKLVIPGEFEMMYNNKMQSFYGRPYSQVKVVHGSWFVCISRSMDAIKCVLYAVHDAHAAAQGCRELHSTKLQSNMLVVPTEGCYGLAAITISDESSIARSYIKGPLCHDYHDIYCCKINSSTCITREEVGYHPIVLRPRPGNVSSAAVMRNVAMLLENDNNIAVYVMEHRSVRNERTGEYENIDNRVCDLSVKELGLSPDCKLQRIWAGDRVDGKSLLHVLYTRPQHGNTLASYTVSEEILNKTLDKNP